MNVKSVIDSPKQVIYLQQRGIAEVIVDGDKVQVKSGMPEYNVKFTVSEVMEKIDELNEFIVFINSFITKDESDPAQVEVVKKKHSHKKKPVPVIDPVAQTETPDVVISAVDSLATEVVATEEIPIEVISEPALVSVDVEQDAIHGETEVVSTEEIPIE